MLKVSNKVLLGVAGAALAVSAAAGYVAKKGGLR
jgi:hypothetical protein